MPAPQKRSTSTESQSLIFQCWALARLHVLCCSTMRHSNVDGQQVGLTMHHLFTGSILWSSRHPPGAPIPTRSASISPDLAYLAEAVNLFYPRDLSAFVAILDLMGTERRTFVKWSRNRLNMVLGSHPSRVQRGLSWRSDSQLRYKSSKLTA